MAEHLHEVDAAVWGDPIAHSRSPQLHRAAYAVLGLDWRYERRQVDAATFPQALATHGPRRGLSLTMPLKDEAFRLASSLDDAARLTGAVNTLVRGPEGWAGFNTDAAGLAASLGDEGLEEVESARIIGAGATARSALVAVAHQGAHTVEVVARRPESATSLIPLAEELGITLQLTDLTAREWHPVTVTIATLPGDATLAPDVARSLAAGGGLLHEVVYGHWPTTLSTSWSAAGERAVSGLGMLLHQAVRQLRVFTGGEPDEPLAEEEQVIAAMRTALEGVGRVGD